MLSDLQLFILTQALKKGSVSPESLRGYYRNRKNSLSGKEVYTSITRSIERLISRGLLVAKGRKTKEKLFIDEVQLTLEGKKRITSLRYQPLPFIR